MGYKEFATKIVAEAHDYVVRANRIKSRLIKLVDKQLS